MLHKNVYCHYLMLGITDQVQFQLFLKAGRVLISRIVAGRLFQVRGPATPKTRSPILVFVPGTTPSDEFDDRSVRCLVYHQRGNTRWCGNHLLLAGLLIAVALRYRYCSGATFTVAVAVAPLLLAESSGVSSAATFG